MVYSSSPNSIISYDLSYDHEQNRKKKSGTHHGTCDPSSGPLSLREFADALPETIRRIDSEKKSKPFGERARADDIRGTEEDPINQLFRRLDVNKNEWKQYALFDPTKKYTRNLIATDDETFTLLLLCWNPNEESPIHDHPCDGCWMRVCEGEVQETRYEPNTRTDYLEMTSDKVYIDGQLGYINDFMGYHKIGNPSQDIPAVTMHLYCPPFKRCKIWLDAMKASCPSKTCMCNYSEYGVRKK